jgi:FKBP-type peptidyl-prolyl cis-trans isomerase
MLIFGLLLNLILGCSEKMETPEEKTQEKQESQENAGSKASPEEDATKQKEDATKKTDAIEIPAPADVKTPPSDAIKTASGLVYKILSKGDGKENPEDISIARVQYTGWTTDGKMAETTTTRKGPTAFPVRAMMPGFKEAAKLMTKGAKARLWVPEELAYKGKKNKPQGNLVYDFELIDFQTTKAPEKVDVPAPADVAAAPSDAIKTASGLAYKVLTPGTGTEKPSPGASVSANYTGWTTDGKMFDSSLKRGKPLTFGLNGVIAGWTEGLQLMVTGEKTRFWIPEELAYKGQKGRPAGMLVFDVELVSIKQPLPAPANVGVAPADATALEKGISYKVLTKGTGAEMPVDGATIEFHYSAWDTTGAMIDSSKMKDNVPKAPFARLPAPWQMVMKKMTTGEKTIVWVPEDQMPKRRGQETTGTITFEIELISFKNPPKAPADVAAPPSDATKTPSGLAYKVLQAGTGTDKAADTNRVKVHYTGWTTDGKMFDSSLTRGTPATFGLKQVIAGWTEGLQLMVVGEKTRFWIPEDLAYQGKPGKPAGMLVFDVELLEIK